MKTSFYFVIWILIYPLLGLLHNPWIDQNSFLVALLFVWALSWFINKSMPETIIYERKLQRVQIMDEVYSAKVSSLQKRLSRNAAVNFVGAVYFALTFLFSLYITIKGNRTAWFELIVFGLLAGGTIIRAAQMQKFAWRLRNNPEPQEGVDIVQEMGLNYAAYYDERKNSPGEPILPPPPRYFGSFQLFSMIIAIICTLLGVAGIVLSLISLTGHTSFISASYGIIYLLYGSLATYYGIRDIITSANYFKIKAAQ